MKLLIIITCILVYFAIGFTVLVGRARKYCIDGEDVFVAMFFWPIVGIAYGIYSLGNTIIRLAYELSEKLPK